MSCQLNDASCSRMLTNGEEEERDEAGGEQEQQRQQQQQMLGETAGRSTFYNLCFSDAAENPVRRENRAKQSDTSLTDSWDVKVYIKPYREE